MDLLQRARGGYAATYGAEPQGVVFAPGRVNLMGDHVDYNDGLVLPMPITAGTAIAWGAAGGAAIEAIALDLDGARDSFAPGAVSPHQTADWRSYVRGTASALAVRESPAGPARLAICGSIPRGSGLSSSASLCVAIGRALAAAAGAPALKPTELALAAQQAEHAWAGVNCGIMDQMAVAAGSPRNALLLDCRDLSFRNVPLPEGWAVMIVQSGVTRGLVDGHYNARRADCEAAARALGLASLRDADAAMIAAAGLEPVARARALHVVEEIARTKQAAQALAAADLAVLGELLRGSHASLRDQFQVSVPAVDVLVEVLNTAIGPHGGARMTGGGFGGAVVAVLAADAVPRVTAAIKANYTAPAGGHVSIMIEDAGPRAAGVMQ